MIAGILGLLILVASLFQNAILGSQVALLGIGVILLGVLDQLRALNKHFKEQKKATELQ